MDRLDAMSVLTAIIDAGSLSGAARRLAMPLATVSRKLSDLEAHLKTRLVLRSTRQLALTDAGRAYVAACRRILEDVDEAERAASGEYSAPRGELVVTAPIVFGRMDVVPVVAEFLQAYPEIDIRLALGDRIVSLADDHVDLAVRIGELPDSSLIAKPLGAIAQVVCASPAYFAARGRPARPLDLGRHHCITFEGIASPLYWRFGDARHLLRVPIRSRLVTNTAEAAIEAALAGLGIIRVLSYQVAEAIRAGVLEPALEAFASPPVPIQLLYPGAGSVPMKLRAFLDFAAPRLRQRVAAAVVEARAPGLAGDR